MPGSAKGRYRDALRARDLRLLLTAFLVDSTGSWAYNVVLVVYVYDRTHSPALITATTACGWVPRLLLSVYAGVVADRVERTRVMAWSALGGLAVGLALTAAVALDGPVLLVLALHAITASSASFYAPAARALVPEAVPERELAAANALFGVLENLVVVVGPAVGGLLLLTGEPALGVAFNALTFLVAALLVRRIRLRSTGGGAEEGGSLLGQVATGLTALRNEPVALVLVLYTALDSAVFGASTVLFVPLAQRFGSGTDGYGYLTAAMALGGVLAGGAVQRLSGTRRLAPVIVGGMSLLALPFALLAGTHSRVPGGLLLVVAGVGMVVVDVLSITALQRDLPRAVLSRVFGVLETLVLAAILLASLAASTLLSRTSVDTVLLVLGLGVTAASLAGMGPLLRADRASAAALAALQPRIALLRELDLFAGAPASALEQLARALTDLELPSGAVLLRQGDPADALYLLVRGELAVSAYGEPLGTVGPHSYVGEIGLIRGSARTATVTVTEPAVLWRLSGPDFLSALETASPSASLMGVVGTRLARTVPHPSLDTARTPVVEGLGGSTS